MDKQEANLSEEYYEELQIQVDKGQTPLRIDKFLLDRTVRISRNKIQQAVRAGSVLVNDSEVKPNYKIRPGDHILLILPRSFEGEPVAVPEPVPLDIRYEDDDLMIVMKPAGMVVHPGIGNPSGTLVNGLAWYFKETELPVHSGNDKSRMGLVHRIDKDTSGLLVIAKTDYALTHLAKQFFHHTIERTYQALVWGEPDPAAGTILAKIGRNPRKRTAMAVIPDDESGGKEAITHYKVLEPLYYVSLVECRLETGRTHQIRVHMAHIGHPIFNDPRYGGDQVVKGTVYAKYKQFVQNTFKVLPRQALHARSLGFVHPVSGKPMYFEAELPKDFQSALDRWRTYLAGKKPTE